MSKEPNSTPDTKFIDEELYQAIRDSAIETIKKIINNPFNEIQDYDHPFVTASVLNDTTPLSILLENKDFMAKVDQETKMERFKYIFNQAHKGTNNYKEKLSLFLRNADFMQNISVEMREEILNKQMKNISQQTLEILLKNNFFDNISIDFKTSMLFEFAKSNIKQKEYAILLSNNNFLKDIPEETIEESKKLSIKRAQIAEFSKTWGFIPYGSISYKEESINKAIKLKDLTIAESIIDLDPENLNINNVIYACNTGFLDFVSYVKNKTGYDYITIEALKAASENGHKDIVELIIDGKDFIANITLEQKADILKLIAKNGHKDTLELLIAHHIFIGDITAKQKANILFDILNEASENGNKDIVEFLITNKDFIESLTAIKKIEILNKAIWHSHLKVIKLFIENDSFIYNITSEQKAEILNESIQNKLNNVIAILISNEDFIEELPVADKEKILISIIDMLSSSYGDSSSFELAKKLITNPSFIENISAKTRGEALVKASSYKPAQYNLNGNIEENIIHIMLLENKFMEETDNKFIIDAFLTAAKNSCLDIVKTILEYPQDIIYSLTPNNKIELLLDIIKNTPNNSITTIPMLIRDYRFMKNITEEQKKKILIEVIESGNLEVLKLFIEDEYFMENIDPETKKDILQVSINLKNVILSSNEPNQNLDDISSINITPRDIASILIQNRLFMKDIKNSNITIDNNVPQTIQNTWNEYENLKKEKLIKSGIILGLSLLAIIGGPVLVALGLLLFPAVQGIFVGMGVAIAAAGIYFMATSFYGIHQVREHNIVTKTTEDLLFSATLHPDKSPIHSITSNSREI